MQKKYNILLLLLLSVTLCPHKLSAYNNHPPKLTIIIVIDQFAYHYINKLYPHLKAGLKYLIDNGVNYTNAHMPHGQPTTATGHAALNTGTYAKDHGFISNSWITDTGEHVACDDDTSPEALVFAPLENNATYDYGKSAHLLMVDGLTDQCVLQSQPQSIFRSFSISGKSRSAIATASKLGKAIWLDSKSGLFTSSKAYYNELPQWLKNFNNSHASIKPDPIIWHRLYSKSPSAYNFFDTDNYQYSRPGKTMMNVELPIPDLAHPKNPYHFFERTPQANQLLLDCAQTCISKHTSRKTKDRLLLWVCLSPLDKLAHLYGPNSIEAIDMIYRLDQQLQKFIRFAIKSVGKHQVALALTADHGIMPLPEVLHNKGLTNAVRIDEKDFLAKINNHISTTHDISDLITGYKGQELVVDQSIMQELDQEQQDTLMNSIKQYVRNSPHIKKVWSFDELLATPTQQNTFEDNFKKQLFKGRSGQIIIEPYPYSLTSHWPQGASHKSPYDYDTHVPLILFHPGKFERRHVRQRVTTLQLANTLAELLNIPKPSASTAEILPELFDPEYQ